MFEVLLWTRWLYWGKKELNNECTWNNFHEISPAHFHMEMKTGQESAWCPVLKYPTTMLKNIIEVGPCLFLQLTAVVCEASRSLGESWMLLMEFCFLDGHEDWKSSYKVMKSKFTNFWYIFLKCEPNKHNTNFAKCRIPAIIWAGILMDVLLLGL